MRAVPPLPVLAAALMATAPAAASDTLCRFVQECFEAEPCSDTDYGLEVGPGPGDFTATLSDVTGDVLADLTLTADGGTVAIGRDDSAFRLLSVAPDGTARYTLHLAEGPMVVSYLGNCESH